MPSLCFLKHFMLLLKKVLLSHYIFIVWLPVTPQPTPVGSVHVDSGASAITRESHAHRERPSQQQPLRNQVSSPSSTVLWERCAPCPHIWTYFTWTFVKIHRACVGANLRFVPSANLSVSLLFCYIMRLACLVERVVCNTSSFL